LLHILGDETLVAAFCRAVSAATRRIQGQDIPGLEVDAILALELD
jgi:hypothetical protein